MTKKQRKDPPLSNSRAQRVGHPELLTHLFLDDSDRVSHLPSSISDLYAGSERIARRYAVEDQPNGPVEYERCAEHHPKGFPAKGIEGDARDYCP